MMGVKNDVESLEFGSCYGDMESEMHNLRTQRFLEACYGYIAIDSKIYCV